MYSELIRNNDFKGLRRYIFDIFPREAETYVYDENFDVVAVETHEHYDVLIDAAIEHNKPDCLRVILTDFPHIHYNTVAMKLLAIGNIPLYNVAKDFSTEVDICISCMCISSCDRVKALGKLLEISENASCLCMLAYANMSFGVVEILEDIHSVLIKYANPDDHIIFEERLLELLTWDDINYAKNICKFITSHPEYKWCDKDGNTVLHYLSSTRFTKDEISSILGL